MIKTLQAKIYLQPPRMCAAQQEIRSGKYAKGDLRKKSDHLKEIRRQSERKKHCLPAHAPSWQTLNYVLTEKCRRGGGRVLLCVCFS